MAINTFNFKSNAIKNMFIQKRRKIELTVHNWQKKKK